MLSGSEESTPSVVYHCVLRGLERLLLSEQLSRLDAESLVKLSVDRVNVHSPHRAMAALGLMLTCMYTGERWARAAGPGPPVSEFRTIPSPVAASWHINHRDGFSVVLKEVLVSATPGEPVCGLTTAPRVTAWASHPGFQIGDSCGFKALSPEPVQSHRVSNGAERLVPGKEKVSPGRTSTPSPAAPDSESVIVAMERVSVLFDR